jgi:hypothetical protein
VTGAGRKTHRRLVIERENALLVIDADAEATIRDRLAEDSCRGDLLTIESVRPWSVWLLASPAT